MGLLREVEELTRQRIARDSKFLSEDLFYFELRVPPSVTGGSVQPFFYPLIIPPESFSMTEPFRVEETYTNGGGLFVEEQGIVGREITIEGTTGFAPKEQKKLATTGGVIKYAATRSFSRTTTEYTPLNKLSGQRHFQFLQDTVFRRYADLKRDEATSEGTELYLHNVKDDEHWRVIPRSFTTERSAAKGPLYSYRIVMLAVQAVPTPESKFSEDKPVLAVLKDKLSMLKSGVDLIRAGLADIALVEQELRLAEGGFVSFLDNTVAIADDTDDLVNGVADIIQAPFNLAQNTLATGEDAIAQLISGSEETTGVGPPANLLNSLRGIVDGLTRIASYPEAFQTTAQQAIASFQKRQSLATARSQSALALAASSTPPQQIRGFNSVGTALSPGDAIRAREDLGLGRSVPAYTSVIEVILSQGDTLENLAARYLGDARNWKYIAIFNDLVAPFISTERLPGTISIGDSLLVPSFDTPPEQQASLVTLGVRNEESPGVHAYGRDLRLDPVDAVQFDFVIDAESGGTDWKTVASVDNVKQALRTRLITERGTDILYHNLGCPRIVGVSLAALGIEAAQLAFVETLNADPRVNTVRKLEFSTAQADTLEVDVTVELRGITQSQRLMVAVPT